MSSEGNPSSGSAKNPVVQVRTVTVPYALPPAVLKGFKNDWPDRVFVQSDDAKEHRHARLAYERREIEREIYNDVKHLGVVVDIGGNPKRHRSRPEVWSCCPILSSEDACREAGRTGIQLQYCNCRFQDCHCVQNPDVYIAIHSLYYITVGDVLAAVNRCHTGKLYALVHRFPDVAGNFANGEATYYQLGNHRVQMTVQSNSSAYEHSNMHWLREGYFSDGCSAVAWSLTKHGPHSEVYMFARAPLGLTVQKPQIKTLAGSLKDKDYYGEVMSGSTGLGRQLVTTGFSGATATIDNIYCFGGYFEMRAGVSTRTFMIPKGYVEDLMVKIAWMPRNAMTWRTFVEKAKTHVVKFDIPDALRADCLTYGPILAFQASAELEGSLLSHMWRTSISRFSFLNRQLEGARYIISRRLLACFGLVVFSAFAAVLRRKSYRKLLVLFVHVYFARHFWKKWKRKKSLLLLEQGYRLYNGTGQSFQAPVGTYEHDPVFLHTTCSPVDKGPLRKGATLIEPDHVGTDTTPALAGLGLLCPTRIPIVYASNGHNEVLSFANRALMPTPTVDDSEFDIFEEWVKCNINLLLNDDVVEPIIGKYYDWNNRFPPSKRRLHDEAKRKLQFGSPLLDIDRICMRKAFTKREKLDQGDFEPNFKSARMIQGCTDTFNVLVGPWVHAFSKFLGVKWNRTADIFYCTGTSANDIGKWYDEVCHMMAAEDDFSKFDTTIGRRMLELEIWVFSRYGCPATAIELMRHSIMTKGHGRHGSVYKVEATRHSGDPQTSTGNSMLNGFVHAYAIHRHENGVHQYGVVPHRMAVIGDDNVLGLARPPDVRHVENVLRKLGLLPNFVAKEWYAVEFCSGRFYPSSEGTILGPKIGKCLQKIGWFLDAHESKQPELLYSTGVGLKKDCNHIPVLRAVADLMIRTARKNKPGVAESVRAIPDDKGRPHAAVQGELVTDVYNMTDMVYHLCRRESQELETYINEIQSLPCSFNHPYLENLFEMDQ